MIPDSDPIRRLLSLAGKRYRASSSLPDADVPFGFATRLFAELREDGNRIAPWRIVAPGALVSAAVLALLSLWLADVTPAPPDEADMLAMQNFNLALKP